MGTVRKRGDTWRAEVWCHGRRISATRDTKAAAVAWVAQTESEIHAGTRGDLVARSVADALTRYAAEVSPTKKGAHWDAIRCAKLARTLPFRGMLCGDVKARDIAAWRDLALRGGILDRGELRPALAGASVRREMGLLRAVFEIARKEWGYLRDNPISGVKRPPPSPSRTRRVSDDEVERLLLACGWGDFEPAESATQRVGVAILLSLYTAMRAGELCGLTWPDVDVAGRVARLPRTKNGDAREVPLSTAAAGLFGYLPRVDDDPRALRLEARTLDTLYRRAAKRAGADAHFHDLRHEAITRLAKRLDVLDLARMIGHRDLRSLMIYYNPTAAELAARLD